MFSGEYKITESNAIIRYIGRKNGLDGKTEMERVRIDMIENMGLSFYMEFAKVAYSPDFVRMCHWIENFWLLKEVTSRWCPGVMKVPCKSCAWFFGEGIPYPLSRCRHVDISIGGRTLRPSVSSLDEYHIPRAITYHFREPCNFKVLVSCVDI